MVVFSSTVAEVMAVANLGPDGALSRNLGAVNARLYNIIVTLYLADEAATMAVGARLATALQPGLVVFLSGELGVGKTTLVRGCLRALGYRGHVKSPTFTLVEVYKVSSLYLHHFDFYRFIDRHEWSDAGFRDVFDGDNVCLVEWPEKAGSHLPVADLAIKLKHADPGRQAEITAHTEKGKQCLRQMHL